MKQFVSGELNYLQAANAIQELKDKRMQMELEKQRRQQEFAKPAPWERDQKRDMSDEAVHARVATELEPNSFTKNPMRGWNRYLTLSLH